MSACRSWSRHCYGFWRLCSPGARLEWLLPSIRCSCTCESLCSCVYTCSSTFSALLDSRWCNPANRSIAISHRCSSNVAKCVPIFCLLLLSTLAALVRFSSVYCFAPALVRFSHERTVYIYSLCLNIHLFTMYVRSFLLRFYSGWSFGDVSVSFRSSKCEHNSTSLSHFNIGWVATKFLE